MLLWITNLLPVLKFCDLNEDRRLLVEVVASPNLLSRLLRLRKLQELKQKKLQQQKPSKICERSQQALLAENCIPLNTNSVKMESVALEHTVILSKESTQDDS